MNKVITEEDFNKSWADMNGNVSDQIFEYYNDEHCKCECGHFAGQHEIIERYIPKSVNDIPYAYYHLRFGKCLAPNCECQELARAADRLL